jgi:tetratricopeptide (TPR) repeat protein
MPTALPLVLAAVLWGQPSAPPLPALALDAYPTAARASIARAHGVAAARPSEAGPVCALARTLHAWEQWDAAHQVYARCQALAPRAFDSWYLDALVLQRLARHDDAVPALQRALAVDPAYLPGRLRLAESLFEIRSLAESRRAFEALSKEPAVEPSVLIGLARIDAIEGRHEQAIARLERAIALFPEFGAAYYALAQSARAIGRTNEARRALARHATFGARWPAVDDPVRGSLAELRDDAVAELQRGVRLSGAGDLAGAIAAHEAAVAKDPAYAQAHANLISLYGQTRNWSKAEAHYRIAIGLDPNAGDAHYDYGVILGLQEKWEAAAEAYRLAIAANPGHASARNNLGQLLERRRAFSDAAEMYRAALASQPAFRLARFNLGRMLIALNRLDEAIAELQPIVEPRDGESPRVLFALGTAHLRAGRKDEGIRLATEARDLARSMGQPDLAAAIDRDLARIK